ncbi:MAG: response regulator transcription factor [Sulfurimonas sp.]|uniref:response regulator transcription factor n=1 Tax=Sulfurimonas sp. TaxID=2022749 RepID=UPI003D11E90E
MIYFSTDQNILDEWVEKFKSEDTIIIYDLESLKYELEKNHDSIIVADFDTVSNHINKLISLNQLPKNLIVLEKSPEIATGRRVIRFGAKAYGNSRMSQANFKQLYETIKSGKVWTYPQLTASLISGIKKEALSKEAIEMIENRLTQKEVEIVNLILKGFTNDAIATKENITLRTVKAHVSSIFSKLHVNDRISLILLLKQ